MKGLISDGIARLYLTLDSHSQHCITSSYFVHKEIVLIYSLVCLVNRLILYSNLNVRWSMLISLANFVDILG